MKKLPPKINPAKFLPSSSSALAVRSIQNKSNVASENNLVVIRTRVIEVKKLIQNHTLLKRKEDDTKRIKDEGQSNEKKELELEKKPDSKEGGKFKVPSLPKLGFLDRIKNFFINVLLGYIAVRLVPYVDKLPAIVGGIATGIDFATDVFIKMFDGLTTFVQKGYEAYDFTKKQLKAFGGDNAVKLFDGFNNALEGVVTAALAASFALANVSDRGGLFDKGPTIGRKTATRVQERYLQRYGEKQFTRRFGEKALQKVATEGTEQTIKRGLLKSIIRRIPIVGGLLDFALNYFIFKESLGESAFRAVGSTLVGAIGGAIGSVIPGPGTLVGAALGGFAGDAVASALYDMIFKNKIPKTQSISNQAEGGSAPVKRGGKLVGGPTRRSVPRKTRRSITVRPTEVKPGSSVGGKDKIEKIFPEVEDKQKTGTVNPLGYMKTSYGKFAQTPGLGGIFAIALKAQLGEKPSDLDYRNASEGLTSWLQRSLSTEIMRTGGAFANGGEVNMGMFGSSTDTQTILAKAIQNTVTPKINETINDLMKELMLKPKEVKKEEKVTEPSPDEELGDATEMVGGARLLMDAGFPMLAASILAGNIQAESGWRGQRTPWVLNDGAGTNKGLISWNRERVVNAEKFLGKPLETASNAEQVKWIKEELKQYGLLDEFMNASSTEAQLKEASYKYIGWGILGDRWKYSSQILSALEKGERGSYTPKIGGMGKVSGGIGPSEIVPDTRGTKLSGDLGDFMKAWGGVRGSIWQHSKHGGRGRRSYSSFHNVDRAIDLGAYANEQRPILRKIEEFNRMRGVRPVELLHAGNDPKGGHNDHIHIAYASGGRVTNPTYAMLGEKGPEFVFDADTTKGLDTLTPGLLEQLNIAKTKPQIASILQYYADYEEGGEQVVEVVSPEPQIIPMMMPVPMGGGMSGGISASDNSSYDTLYHGH